MKSVRVRTRARLGDSHVSDVPAEAWFGTGKGELPAFAHGEPQSGLTIPSTMDLAERRTEMPLVNSRPMPGKQHFLQWEFHVRGPLQHKLRLGRAGFGLGFGSLAGV